MVRAATVAVTVALAAPTPAAAQTAGTVELLTTAIESLEAGDVVGYEAAADELREAGHWLPDAGWTALDAGDADQLVLVWLLLEAPGEEPLLVAFDQVLFERELVLTSSATSAADRALLDLVDGDGETVLQVIDHRRIGISPEAREVLTPLPDDPADWPTVEHYDQVIAMMANRIESIGFSLPPAPGIDEILEGFPLEELPPPPPLHERPKDDAATARPEIPVEPLEPAEPLEPIESIEPAEAPAQLGDVDAIAIEDPISDGSTTPAEDTGQAPPPVTSPSDPGPVTIVIGVIGALGLAVGAVAIRRHRHHHELVGIAHTDSLTGLGNRRRLDRDLSRERGNGARPTSLLMIDVDHFKQFNDRHGHVVGDEALRHVARLIGDNVRRGDLTYRYGGEEFSVLLPDTSPDEANDIGERIRHAIEAARIDLSDGSTVAVTASLGLSSGPAGEVDVLVQRADEALYVAKDNGRNRLARA